MTPSCYTTRAMERIVVSIDTEGPFRATEAMADLRNVAETLFFPMRFVAFWDTQADGAHLCRQEELGRVCPHRLPLEDPQYEEYSATAERDMRATLEVSFQHAGVVIYLR